MRGFRRLLKGALCLAGTLLPGCDYHTADVIDESTVGLEAHDTQKKGTADSVYAIVFLSTGGRAGAGLTVDLSASAGLFESSNSRFATGKTNALSYLALSFKAPADTTHVVVTARAGDAIAIDTIRVID